MRKEFKKKFLANAGLTLGAAFLLLIMNYFIFSDMELRVKELRNLKDEVILRSEAKETLRVLEEESRRASVYYNILFQVLPSREQLINFRKTLLSLAEERGVDLGFVFGADSASVGDKPGFAEFQAVVSGQESNFMPFLKAVESSSYLVRLDSVDLSVDKGKFNAGLRGRVYSR